MRKGLLIAVVMSSVLLGLFFSGPLSRPNATFFATRGDGLKEYFVSAYYLKYDTAYSHSSVMNYPYGEHAMFTGNQPSISFPVKFISNNIADVSHYTVGILNMFMLLSILLGAVFIYLLLTHFKLHFLYSALVAVGIAFLSPQIGRMGGHFSLSYVFVIPLIFYLIALHHQRKLYIRSALLGVLMLWCAGTHVYMMGFYAFIVLCYWMYVIVSTRNNGSFLCNSAHFVLQFLLPLLVFVLYVVLTDSVTDRPDYPYGFLVYRAYPESVFLPTYMHNSLFISRMYDFSYIDWEGRAYVGAAAASGFLVMVVVFIFKLAEGKNVWNFTYKKDDHLLEVYFWISILALLYSFGVPFIYNLERLVDFLGPLKQMRGIARFSWLFYYVLNIFVFYQIWHLKKYVKKYAWVCILTVSLIFLWYDAITNISFWSKNVNNEMPAITDVANELPQNEWFQHIEISDYQAILPLPYFHVGSENISYEPRDRIDLYTAMVSWKTGIPSTGVFMSRTSLSQTINLCELIWEPYRKPEVLNLMNTEQDLLVVSRNTSNLPCSQKNILSVSELVYSGHDFDLYRLSLDTISSLFENLYENTYKVFANTDLHEHGDYYTNSPEMNFYVSDFSAMNTSRPEEDAGYFIPGSKSIKIWPQIRIVDVDLPGNEDVQEYVLSFWIHNIYTDMLLRSQLIMEILDAYGKTYDYSVIQLFREVAVVDGDWAMIEIYVSPKQAGSRILCTLRNPLLKKDTFNIDHIMIRNVDTDIYRMSDSWIMRNNRFYHVPG